MSSPSYEPVDQGNSGTLFIPQRMKDDSVPWRELRYSLGGMTTAESVVVLGRAIKLLNQDYGYNAVSSMEELTSRLEEKLAHAFAERYMELKVISPGTGYVVIDQLLPPHEELWETFSYETLREPSPLVQFEYLSRDGELTVRSGRLRRVRSKTISVATAEGTRTFSQERVLSFGSTKRLGLASPQRQVRLLTLRLERVAFFGIRAHWSLGLGDSPRYKMTDNLKTYLGKIAVSEGDNHG